MAENIPAKKEDSEDKFIKSRIQAQKNKLDKWQTLWEQVRTFVAPLRDDLYNKKTKGSQRSDQIYDTTAVAACRKLASGLYAHNISTSQSDWFSFQPRQTFILEHPPVKRWFAQLNEAVVLDVMASNFLLESHIALHDLASYGTCCLYVSKNSSKDGLFFKAHPIGSYSFDCDENGFPSTVYVKYKKTASQLIDKFGKENVSSRIREADIKRQRTGHDEEFTVWHIVGKKKKSGIPSKFGKKKDKFPYFSAYYEEESGQTLQGNGYQSQPYIVARFYKNNHEDFGHSPATEAMPDIKDANATKHLLRYATGSHIKPPLFVPSNGVVDLKRLNLQPDGKNEYNSSMGGDKPFYLPPSGNPPLGWEELNDIRNSIKQAFYWEMFDTLGAKTNMTALEVSERIEQQLELFAPTQGRIQSELFTPLLERSMNLVTDYKNIPPPPKVVEQNPDYDIIYRSKLSLSIQNVQTKGFVKVLNMLAPYIQSKPEMLDNYDFDQAARDMAYAENVPAKWIKPASQVQQERQQRAKQKKAQQQQQLKMKMMEEGIQNADKLEKVMEKAETPEGQNMLAELRKQAGKA